MKKIFALVTAVIMLASATFAQTAKQAPKKMEAKTKEVKKEAPKKVEVKKTAPKIKADGTPDKRFKENKKPEKSAGPVKKDGTPDMRYNKNKKKG